MFAPTLRFWDVAVLGSKIYVPTPTGLNIDSEAGFDFEQEAIGGDTLITE